MTQRVISVFLPRWPTDRLARTQAQASRDNTPSRPDAPLVMVARIGRRRAVAAMNEAAADRGLRIGQAIAHATAMVPGLVLHELDPQADRAALERLALWAQRYSPVTAADGADGVVIDATGCAHLFGGEEKMAIDIASRLSQVGLESRVAIADSWGGAHALARYALRKVFVVAPGATGRQIENLPIEALRLPAELVATLVGLGLNTIGKLDAKPAGPLAHRFGQQLVLRLAQAYGRTAEPITPAFSPETLRVSRVFAEPISAPETMARYLTQLTGEICTALEEASQGARRLDAYFVRVDNRIEKARIGLSAASRDAPRLAKLLCAKLETVDPGLGVEKILLAAPGAEPLAFRQLDAVAKAKSEADISNLVDTLSALGMGVYRQVSAQSDIPERSVRKASPLGDLGEISWPMDWPRPSRLLPRPEPIETVALLPDAPPGAFTWRGGRRRVRCADGPERVYAEWWKTDAELTRSRDYFLVEDENGERFWIFRDGDGEHAESGSQRWFMHGLFG